ncbi:unnamed protein product, partial [Brugia pahangi]|uniref:Uncharacterized protein n=1 Tax=Brugia pahangi TaxID=6280 RepID=A0A0N4TQA2_BRUPA
MVKMKKGIIFLLIIAFSSSTKATTPGITAVTTAFFTLTHTITTRTVSSLAVTTALPIQHSKKSLPQLLLIQQQLYPSTTSAPSTISESTSTPAACYSSATSSATKNCPISIASIASSTTI